MADARQTWKFIQKGGTSAHRMKSAMRRFSSFLKLADKIKERLNTEEFIINQIKMKGVYFAKESNGKYDKKPYECILDTNEHSNVNDSDYAFPTEISFEVSMKCEMGDFMPTSYAVKLSSIVCKYVFCTNFDVFMEHDDQSIDINDLPSEDDEDKEDYEEWMNMFRLIWPSDYKYANYQGFQRGYHNIRGISCGDDLKSILRYHKYPVNKSPLKLDIEGGVDYYIFHITLPSDKSCDVRLVEKLYRILSEFISIEDYNLGTLTMEISLQGNVEMTLPLKSLTFLRNDNETLRKNSDFSEITYDISPNTLIFKSDKDRKEIMDVIDELNRNYHIQEDEQ